MGEIKEFVLTLVGISVSSALIDSFLPEGGMKKFVKYFLALMILMVLISPLKEVISSVPSLCLPEHIETESIEAYTKANAIVANRIERALCEKFSIDNELVDVVCDSGKIKVNAKWRLGFVASDFVSYIENNFGLLAEVSFYE